jgi:mercury(II) reductase
LSEGARHDCCGSGRAFDIAVIGAGSAGFSAAIAAAGQGARVALIGHGTIGGTCVNVGCVPSRTLIRAAEAIHGAGAAGRFAGIEAGARLADWPALRRQKDALVTGLRQAKYADLLAEYEAVDYREGRARLTAAGIAVDGAEIATPRVVIATGSAPAAAPIPGIESVDWLDSTAALALDTLPRSMLVLGAGYVGAELAQAFARLGVEVTLVCRRRLLSEAEPEIGAALTRCFGDEGIRVVGGAGYRRVAADGAGVTLEVERDCAVEELRAERLLLATGRRPNSAGMGLEEQAVELVAGGGIAVDDRMRTSRPGIYAAGDVTGRDMFVYMAAHGGKIAALNALNGDNRRYDDSAIPGIIFTDPQVAMVGLGEAAARAGGRAVRMSLVPLDQVPRALAARDTRGLVKLVADARTDRLLGAHILAPEGADSIQTAVLAIKHGMTTQELGETIFPYLTTAEALKLAALGCGKDVRKLSCCAG